MGKKLRRILSIFLSIAMVLGYIPSTGITAYAGDNDTYTITFSANGKSKKIEGVTLPHTFSCDKSDADGELDQIIQELYNLAPDSSCDADEPNTDSGSITCGLNGENPYITISGAYDGVATVWEGTLILDLVGGIFHIPSKSLALVVLLPRLLQHQHFQWQQEHMTLHRV